MENERVFVHAQKYPFRFQSNTYAAKKGGTGKGLFSIEVMVYVPGAGWDIVDINVHDNELVLGYIKAIEFKEFMGLEHVGHTSVELKRRIEELWGHKIE